MIPPHLKPEIRRLNTDGVGPTQIARELGLTYDQVRGLLLRPVRHGNCMSVEREALLGTLPDRELAVLWCVSTQRVGKARRDRGIPPFGGGS